ncbi:MAG: 2-oxoacid:acceptor oxidoreductase family protein, partial [Anaerolineales bacterium]
MQTEILISGFGGQGVLFAGQLLAYAGLDYDMHVTWIPSYGPEMRGGTAHCTTILSDEAIGSPEVRNPKAVMVMNLPSLDKYEDLVKEGGILVVNTSLVDRIPERKDITVILIPANEIAEEMGDRRLANMVMTGALMQKLGTLTLDQLAESLDKHIPSHRRNLLEANIKAMNRGAELA